MIGNRLYCSMHTRTHTHTTNTFHSYVSIAHQIEWDGGFPRDCQCKEIPIIKIDDSNKNLLPFFCNLLFIFLLIPDYYCHTYTHTHHPRSISRSLVEFCVVDRVNDACNLFSHSIICGYAGEKNEQFSMNYIESKKAFAKKMNILCMMIWNFRSIPILSFTQRTYIE